MRYTNPRIMILCQGMTEYLYSKALKETLIRSTQRKISIEIDYESKDLTNLINTAVKLEKKANNDKNPYTTIWLIFDNDNFPRLKECFERIREEKFKYVYSSMCFEHWFILHFEECGRTFNNAAATLKHLKKIWPEYDKTKMNHYAILKKNLPNAKARALKNRINISSELEIYERNPFNNIDELIDYLDQLNIP